MRYAAIAAAAMALLLISGCAAKPEASPPVTPTSNLSQICADTPNTEETISQGDVAGLSFDEIVSNSTHIVEAIFVESIES